MIKVLLVDDHEIVRNGLGFFWIPIVKLLLLKK